jgi:hypothetical protein
MRTGHVTPVPQHVAAVGSVVVVVAVVVAVVVVRQTSVLCKALIE